MQAHTIELAGVLAALSRRPAAQAPYMLRLSPPHSAHPGVGAQDRASRGQACDAGQGQDGPNCVRREAGVGAHEGMRRACIGLGVPGRPQRGRCVGGRAHRARAAAQELALALQGVGRVGRLPKAVHHCEKDPAATPNIWRGQQGVPEREREGQYSRWCPPRSGLPRSWERGGGSTRVGPARSVCVHAFERAVRGNSYLCVAEAHNSRPPLLGRPQNLWDLRHPERHHDSTSARVGGCTHLSVEATGAMDPPAPTLREAVGTPAAVVLPWPSGHDVTHCGPVSTGVGRGRLA
jgi:hypothetical protein